MSAASKGSNTSAGVRPFAPDDFYRAYGIAMLSWQHVEHALFRVYWSLFEHSALKEAGAAFYSLDSFGAKCRLVDQTAKVMLSADGFKAWRTIEKRMRDASVHRNVLAHLTVVADFHTDGSLELVMAPSIFVPTALVRTKKRYDTSECAKLAGEFEKLSEEIGRFERSLQRDSGVLQKPVE